MKNIFYIFALTSVFQVGNGQTSIDYFGQTPPGDTAMIFAPGIISMQNRPEGQIAFSPDGNECYFDVFGDSRGFINYTKRINGQWTEQEEAPFSINRNVYGPVFSRDGNRIYFAIDTNKNKDIGFVERTATGWGDPQLLSSPVNLTSRDDGYTITSDGVIYFASDRQGGYGKNDIWCKRPFSNQAENLGPVVNSSAFDFDPCIAPDGSYLIFSSIRSGGYTYQDLYISFNKRDSSWTLPISMEKTAAKINMQGFSQLAPTLSLDGKYLFYCHHTYSSSRDIIDVYWVSTHVIVGLRKAAFAPKLNKQIPDMTIKADSAFYYLVPDNTFSSEYSVDSLKYSVTLSDGTDLPSWLNFNNETKTFTGTPTMVGTISVKVIATNIDSANISCNFRITVTNPAGFQTGQNHQPEQMELNQNYPNPFNPTTTIRYSLSSSSEVSVIVRNLLGQKIKTLVESFQTTGEYSSVWDATNENNNPAASGIYFCTLKAGNRIFQKKMLLIR